MLVMHSMSQQINVFLIHTVLHSRTLRNATTTQPISQSAPAFHIKWIMWILAGGKYPSNVALCYIIYQLIRKFRYNLCREISMSNGNDDIRIIVATCPETLGTFSNNCPNSRSHWLLIGLDALVPKSLWIKNAIKSVSAWKSNLAYNPITKSCENPAGVPGCESLATFDAPCEVDCHFGGVCNATGNGCLCTSGHRIASKIWLLRHCSTIT